MYVMVLFHKIYKVKVSKTANWLSTVVLVRDIHTFTQVLFFQVAYIYGQNELIKDILKYSLFIDIFSQVSHDFMLNHSSTVLPLEMLTCGVTQHTLRIV